MESRIADNRSNRSLSPVLIREKKRELPPMSIHYKKTLHDEVVHIMNNLGPSLQFDLSKTFSNQKKTINKKLLPAKMSQRKKGLQHLILTKDDILSECHPHNLTWEEFIKDCKKAVNTSEIHSDEWSSNDEELANAEHTEEIGISIGTGLSHTRYRSDNNVDKKSEPNESMSSWWISSTWAAQESDDDEEEEDNNNDDNNEDNNDDNHDDNHDDNNDDDNNDADNNDGKKDDDCPFHLVVSEEIRSSISSTKKNSLPKKKKTDLS
ncbi:unnamed protein product [Rhizophagus irregularis]|nr:unnamed protein product [Rhizophagus irregularis]